MHRAKDQRRKKKSEFLLLGTLYQAVFFFASGTSWSDLGVLRTMETSALEVTGVFVFKAGNRLIGYFQSPQV